MASFRSETPSRRTLVETILITLLALGLYLPFLAIQYDTNGISEAAALEAGQLVNKNHLIYRPVGLLLYRALEGLGYRGNSLPVLQVLNAICGAIGAGLAYALYKSATRDRAAAAAGSFWLATSFVYWMFSTDAAYITMAAMFALGGMVCIAYSRSSIAVVAAAGLLSLSILTWQAGIFLVPTIVAFIVAGGNRQVLRHAVLLLTTTVLTTGLAFALTACIWDGVRSPAALWTWFTHYSESGTLPLWGVWEAGRFRIAAVNAARSIVPVLLAVNPTQINQSVQLGRVAVDVAIIGVGALVILAAWKTRANSLLYVLGYALFVPFIVWWDPFEPKWFLIPNIFLAGFLSCGLQPWLRRKPTALIVIACTLAIAIANFVTTIRPRHILIGPDRVIAQCVADHMMPRDAFVAAEWGWPDYLEYLHSRKTLNVISIGGVADDRMSRVKAFIISTQQSGGDVHLADPHSYSEGHLEWLSVQTGITVDHLLALGGSPSFKCSDRVILRIPSRPGN